MPWFEIVNTVILWVRIRPYVLLIFWTIEKNEENILLTHNPAQKPWEALKAQWVKN
jgi:hypothetical protein